MAIWKSVVGKLWMTIIALVGIVLLGLSIFLNQTVDQYFSNPKEQAGELEQLAQSASRLMAAETDESKVVEIANRLLVSQASSMTVIKPDGQTVTYQEQAKSDISGLDANRFFTEKQFQQVFHGAAAIHAKKGSILAVAVPILKASNTAVPDVLVVFQSLQSSEDTQAYIERLFIYAAVIAFLLTTFFAFFLSTKITQPLSELKKAADQITRGDYSVRVYPHSNDEIGLLAKTFNHMGKELEETILDLSQEKEHVSSVLRSMADAVIVFDAEGMVMLANPPGQRIIREWRNFSWSDEDTEVNMEGAFCKINQIPEPLSILFDSLMDHSKELSTKLHVQKQVWSVIMAPLYSKSDVRGAVAVLRDVTEEYKLDKLRKDFVANVSHELRTPLSMLQGYSEALIDDIAGTPEERNELAQVIYDESLRMGRLVKDLLDLARMEAGHTELKFSKVSLPALARRVYRKFTVLAKEREIQLHLDVQDENLVHPSADEDRLEQVLTNLMDNAIRHTPKEKGITIRVKRVFEAESFKEFVLVEIEDQGQGIPTEDLPYVFERFYKADKARTRGSSGGTGLGLAIVKNIVEAHQGTVSVTSTIGKGTTFSIMIPFSFA